MNTFASTLLSLLLCCTLGASTAQQEAVGIHHTQDRQSLKTAIQRSMLEAKESILIFTFTLSETSTIELLNQKAQEGVKVTVVIDKEHRLPITAQGNGKIEILTRTSGEGRIHHKALVIDQEIVWLGSANITESAFSTQENVMIRLQSQDLAADLVHEKEVFAMRAKRAPTSPVTYSIGGQPVLFGLLPHDGFPPKKEEAFINKQAKNQLFEIIRQAKSRLYLAMMVWTDPELAQAVIEARRRGVEVLVLAADLGGVVPELLRAGCQVKVNPKFRLMHNKFMYVDGKTFVNGSANWSKSSFTRNDESFVVLYQLSDEQQALLDNYWNYLWPK